ncbi:MAG: response regulator [Lachnospiraceae bacterium]|nr:response regulator [Lachnospiraceae bacterium]
MQKKNVVMDILQWILWLFMVATILYFVIGELVLPSDELYLGDDCNTYHSGWVYVLPDGTEHSAIIPGECEVAYGEVLAIEKELPENQKDTWISIRSSQQDICVYVGDELREEYTTKHTRRFGKNSVSVYVFFPIYEEDAGKTLRLEIVSNSPYSGYINEIYEGDRSDIWRYYFKMYLPGTLVALCMMLLSFTVVVYSNILHYLCKRRMEILYLGSGLMLASIWLLAESRLRQIILPNSTIASNVGFLMVMLMPYPFLAFINYTQKRRYQVVYMLIAGAAIINMIMSTLLQVFNIMDFSETMGLSHVILVVLIVSAIITVIVDVKRGYIKDYPEVSVGLVGMMLAGLYEIYLVYDKSSMYNGVVLCFGLVFLLLMAGIKTGRDMMDVEKEKQRAVIANESKDMFLANMSHEIRTPINTVIGMNEMILRENKDESITEYANNIKQASKMLLSLINDVLDFSKIEAGKLQIIDGEYDVSALLKDVVSGMEGRLKEKHLQFQLNIDEMIPVSLYGDEIRIRQILNNLFSNAVKYTEQGSVSFSVKGERKGDICELQISVKDTGMGIRDEDLEHLFDSFKRLEMKKNRYIEGTGLGLCITKQLVEQMQGSIMVESEYGKGSCFTICIPQRVVNDAPLGENAKAWRKDLNFNQATQRRLYAPDAKVLVVDDNKMNLHVVKALLKNSGIQLDLVDGGMQCIASCKEKKYDLILMDHMMPEPDGVETLHLIREDEKNLNCDTEVIVLTANAIAGAEEEYRKAGFADYLSKPVDSAKLEEVLAKYLMNEE